MTYKKFENNEIFTAADANLLMRQGRISVANEAERDAIESPEAGMQVYRQDLAIVEEFDGSVWSDGSTSTALAFTAVSAVNLDGVFKPGFSVYRVTVNITGGSAAAALSMQYRAAGANLSAANTYITQAQYNDADSSFFTGKTTSDKAALQPGATDSPRAITFDVYNALATLPTLAQVRGFTWISGHHVLSNSGIRFTPTTAVNGFSIYPASGTITGSISVVGVM